MSRPGVDYEAVKQTAVKLLSRGIAPSVQKIRDELGTGSNTTIAEHLKLWREEFAKKTIHHLPANMPKDLISTFEVLWQTAMEHAQNQLAEYKKTVENECLITLQKKEDAERTVAALQLRFEELSLKLEHEIAAKQAVVVELAIINDRLIKQDEALTAQRNHYEDRLKRVYEEKDNLIIECKRLQADIKTFHEKLATQADEHKRLLAQQHSWQEQSETRWLNLIDQARQEAKEERKKIENIRYQHEEQIKKVNLQLSRTEGEANEKGAHLKAAQERITQLGQEVKFIEAEYIKSRAIIIKFEEEKAISLNSKK